MGGYQGGYQQPFQVCQIIKAPLFTRATLSFIHSVHSRVFLAGKSLHWAQSNNHKAAYMQEIFYFNSMIPVIYCTGDFVFWLVTVFW